MSPARKVYLDHSSTTPVRAEVLSVMMPFFAQAFGNASSIHRWGREARVGVETAREKVAYLLGAEPSEIVFTSGGTEADNLALRSTAHLLRSKGNHIITTAVEHHAVLHTCQVLEKEGYEVTYLPVDKYGMVSVESVREAIRPETILISVMHGQNEVGTIQPIEEIGLLAKEKGILLHTDAVQSAGKIPTKVRDMNVDLMTISSHKMYGPKGIGALYVRKGIRIAPQITGGAHERGRRAGTENVAGIVGFGEACYLAERELEAEGKRLTTLRDKLINGILEKIPDTVLNGHPTKRLPHNVNVSIKYVEGESVLLNLDRMGVGASSGSACTSGSLEPSHVLLAMGVPHEVAHGSIRMTLGRMNTEEDIDYVLEVLPPIVSRLREMSAFSASTDSEVCGGGHKNVQ
ncbi:MAG TPA: cysteine desulfurase NifS [Firmicutes bacterium]|nr:cysteine desulfurase NifS [Candidatus Fermentithermobacillaceae bacterium]